MKMLTIGLTGNIGSGKSTISAIFSTLGIPVYHADDESKNFLDSENVIHELIKLFGYSILSNSGKINRRSLASIVFTDGNALKLLNSVLHPLVIQDFQEWKLKAESVPYVIQEAAILYESGLAAEYDFIIHVSCPKEIAIERVIKRDHLDGNSVRNRMNFQMDDAEKAALSDFVILNDGSQLLIPQVLAIHKKLLQISAERNDNITAGAVDA